MGGEITDTVAAYRNGKLYSQKRGKVRAFDPEPIIVQTDSGGSIYMLLEKTG